MKKLNIFYILLLVFGLPGCYDDLGNYDYREINEIEVDSIRSLYEVDVDDSLCINPIIRGTQYSDTSRFTYEWEIANKIVDSTHNLNIVVNMSPGNKVCRYIVKDKETSVKRYYQFRLNVSSSTAGDLLMVLSKYQGRAELSYLRLDKEANWAINYYQERNGEDLGKEPQQLLPCYAESTVAYPFSCWLGRLMVLCDNQVSLFDKSTLQIDTLHPYLAGEDYTGVASYPEPDIEGYKSEYLSEVIDIWRQNAYGSGYQTNNTFCEISGGTLYTVNNVSNGVWSPNYKYKAKSPYVDGKFTNFAYWDAMTPTLTEPGKKAQYGYDPGDLIVFDEVNGRFAYANYGSVYEIKEADVKAFPGYRLFWGSATVRPNDASIAVITNGSDCKLLMLEDGKDDKDRDTKKLVGEVSGGNVVGADSKFYMMKNNEYLFFSNKNKLYLYNILNISSKSVPSEGNKVLDLSDYGYDAEVVITDVCVSRTERTLILGVSRYGSDAEAMGDEAKGDILYFDLNASTLNLTYREDKSAKGVAGIPVDVEIKYQTHWRDGIDATGSVIDKI